MKKILSVALLLAVAFLGVSQTGFAGTLSGTVKSVDASLKQLDVESAEGVQTVFYNESTIWPADVTDPASLVEKQVELVTDEISGEVVTVSIPA